ncbi:MAG TPA: RsmE family RNA methyltransferase [Chitinophagaceae bacterium]|nr:RsmE family RNA methyltransferase [Chitinophagaceae bacterium]
MAAPTFYCAELVTAGSIQFLDEETSKHLIQVLRKVEGDEVLLTDGKGSKARAVLTEASRKKTGARLISVHKEEEKAQKVSIAISLIKNTSRFEWFLEKATEIGVFEIIPLLCERTEKEKVRFDRMQNIVVSAMLQSQQSWLPDLTQPLNFEQAIARGFQQKLIAHCTEANKHSLVSLLHREVSNPPTSSVIFIGPEGDFTNREIEAALNNEFIPVSLGTTRLRTETAGIVAATLLVNRQ